MASQELRIVKAYTHRVSASKDRVFPLLCPKLEIEWLDGWSYEMVYSESGVAELDCVFRTEFPDRGDAVWVVSVYDPEAGRIEFVITHWNTHIERLEIAVREIEDALSELHWRRTYTSLNDGGRKLVNDLTDSAFSERMDWIARSLDHFCRTGRRLRLPAHR